MFDTLELEKYEPDNKNLEPLNIYFRTGYHSKRLTIEITEKDINCSNKEEVKEAIRRRAKTYFDEVETTAGAIQLKMKCKRGWLVNEVYPRNIITSRQEADQAFKNTMDDVFGMGCVKVKQ